VDGGLTAKTYEFLEHALVQGSLGFPTPVVFLRVRYEPSVATPESGTHTWLLASRQFQCSSNCLRQFSLILVILTVLLSKRLARVVS
jgi:hypothetical protein